MILLAARNSTVEIMKYVGSVLSIYTKVPRKWLHQLQIKFVPASRSSQQVLNKKIEPKAQGSSGLGYLLAPWVNTTKHQASVIQTRLHLPASCVFFICFSVSNIISSYYPITHSADVLYKERGLSTWATQPHHPTTHSAVVLYKDRGVMPQYYLYG